MSKLTDSFKTISIYNEFNFAVKGSVFIYYCPADNGRGGRAARWFVMRPGFKTDPNSHWQDYGNKAFPVYRREERASQLEAAKEWASKRYGIKNWAKTPYGSWMDAAFVEKRVAELKNLVKASAKP